MSEKKCQRCGKVDDRTNAGRCCCKKCAENQRKQDRRRYNQRISEKRCTKCGKQDKRTLNGKTICFMCAINSSKHYYNRKEKDRPERQL